VRQLEVEVPGGRTVHVYDSFPDRGDPEAPVVFWHHGTPQSGRLPALAASPTDGQPARFVSHDRPGYGTSDPLPGRDVAAVAGDVDAIADALKVERFAVLGASGGGPHALACAAVLGDRVRAVGCLASLAPFDAAGLDWFAGMAPSGVAEFTAASRGASDLLAHLTRDAADDLGDFAPADMSVFAGPYGDWLVTSSTEAIAAGYTGAVEDDLAFVEPWGFDVAAIEAPVLLVQGGADRFVPPAHAQWLAATCRRAELRLTPRDGHISIFTHLPDTVAWLLDHEPGARTQS
jgi:pimeloyl-ACP methyl ester carboxylesterase